MHQQDNAVVAGLNILLDLHNQTVTAAIVECNGLTALLAQLRQVVLPTHNAASNSLQMPRLPPQGRGELTIDDVGHTEDWHSCLRYRQICAGLTNEVRDELIGSAFVGLPDEPVGANSGLPWIFICIGLRGLLRLLS